MELSRAPLFYVRCSTEDITIKSKEKLSTSTLRNNTFSMSINRHKYERHYKMRQGARKRGERAIIHGTHFYNPAT